MGASAWRREATVRAAVAAGQAAKKRIEALEEGVITLPELLRHEHLGSLCYAGVHAPSMEAGDK